MLKHGEVNPLNVHGLRQVYHCPPHFETVTFDLLATETDITDWIYENLSSRFYIGSVDSNRSDQGPVYRQTQVAFENHGEASYFSLFLQQINVSKLLW